MTDPAPTLTEIVTPREPLTPEAFDELAARWAEESAADEPVAVTPRPAPHWVPADEGAANWAAAKLRTLNDELRQVTEHRNLMLQQIADWYDRRRKAAVARSTLLEAALREYALRWYEEDPKRRTLPLPEGALLKVRVPKTRKVDVVSEVDVLRWARDMGYGPAIKTTPDEIYVSEVRKLVEARQVGDNGEYKAVDKRTGQVVDGLEVAPLGGPEASVAL